MPIIIDNGDKKEIVIIRKNDYFLLVNDKVVVLSMDGKEWLQEDKLTQEEYAALQIYLLFLQ